MNGSTTDNAKRVVDQLRRESNLPRMKLSQAAQDLVKYAQDNNKDDFLLNGFSNDKQNPYRPKSNFQCMVL